MSCERPRHLGKRTHARMRQLQPDMEVSAQGQSRSLMAVRCSSTSATLSILQTATSDCSQTHALLPVSLLCCLASTGNEAKVAVATKARLKLVTAPIACLLQHINDD